MNIGVKIGIWYHFSIKFNFEYIGEFIKFLLLRKFETRFGLEMHSIMCIKQFELHLK